MENAVQWQERKSAAYRMCNMFIVSEHLCICRTLKWNMCSFPTSQGLQTPIHFTEAILRSRSCSVPFLWF